MWWSRRESTMFGQPAGRSQLGWLRRRHRLSVVDRFRQQPGGCLTRLPPPRRGSLIPEFTGTTGKQPFCSHQRTACAPPSLVSGEYIFTLAANAASTKKRIVLNGIAVLVVSVLVYEWWTGSPPSAPVRHVTAGGATTRSRRRSGDWWTIGRMSPTICSHARTWPCRRIRRSRAWSWRRRSGGSS